MPTANQSIAPLLHTASTTICCQKCSLLNPPDSTFCTQCGSEIGEPLGYRTKMRWVILALVFFGTSINYIDRQVLSLLAPQIQSKYHIGEAAYGRIAAAFSLSYAIGQLGAGGWLDRVGTRIGYGLALFGWSIASMLHSLVSTALGFGIVRTLLGVAESPAYPAATKIIAEWFPRRERAYAMGWVNGGSNLGALLVPLVVPWIAIKYGVPYAFLFTGGIGLIFLLFWAPIYRKPQLHSRVSKAELAYILSDPPEGTKPVPWLSLFEYPQAWSFIASKFITDSIWVFFIFFSTKFLSSRFPQLNLAHIGLPMIVIYMMADVGSIGGGWISSFLMRRGVSVNVARKTAMLICALCVVPVMLAPSVENLWVAVFLVGLAMASHQGFSANQYTTVSDMFPRRAVGSVAGMGGSAGYIGGTILSLSAGYLLEKSHGNYQALFIVAGSAYLVALGIMHAFAPRLERAAIPDDEVQRGFEVIPPQ